MKMNENTNAMKDGVNLSTGVVVHKGEYVRNIIRKLGIKISSVAAALDLSRNTLYHKFSDPELSVEFIQRVGQIIKYDFSKKISDIQPSTYFAEEPLHIYTRKAESTKTEQKYIELLEKYNYIMELLARVALTRADETVLKQISVFLEKNLQETKK